MNTALPVTLTLVRHGQVPQNLTHVLEAEVPGPSLTALGREQAERLVERLADRPVDGIAVSTMVRTQETARPLAEARGLSPLVLGGLREISTGNLQGRDDDEARSLYWDTVHAWPDGELDGSLPGGETGHEFYARFDEAIRQCLMRGWRHPVLITHQAATQIWSRRQAGLTREWVRARSLPNTGVVEFVGSPETGWSLTRWEGEAD